jgi:hypothetical protein
MNIYFLWRFGEKMNAYVDGNEFPDCFPENFKEKILPQEARPQDLEVYRVCRDGIIHKESFLSSFEEKLQRRPTEKDDPGDPSTYSTTCFSKRKDISNSLKLWRKHDPNPIIAKGKTSINNGLIQKTKERTHCKSSHIDWWIYKGKDVSVNFVDQTAEFIKKE